jgi:hypothetical protein
MNKVKCGSCFAPIVFAKTEQGKSMPLDAMPLLVDGVYELGADEVARFVPKDARAGKPPLFVPHFASCSHADAHRKPRKR